MPIVLRYNEVVSGKTPNKMWVTIFLFSHPHFSHPHSMKLWYGLLLQ